MVLSTLSRFTKIGQGSRPRLQVFTRGSSTNIKEFVPKNWQKRIIGAVAGTAGLLLCAFSLKNAFAEDQKKKRIVVLGCGWGAVSFLKNLKPHLYEVVVVSPTNYFIFTPFLASVTVGTIEARTICEPIRKILGNKHKSSARYYEAECTDVDFENKKIVCVKENEGKVFR